MRRNVVCLLCSHASGKIISNWITGQRIEGKMPFFWFRCLRHRHQKILLLLRLIKLKKNRTINAYANVMFEDLDRIQPKCHDHKAFSRFIRCVNIRQFDTYIQPDKYYRIMVCRNACENQMVRDRRNVKSCSKVNNFAAIPRWSVMESRAFRTFRIFCFFVVVIFDINLSGS